MLRPLELGLRRGWRLSRALRPGKPAELLQLLLNNPPRNQPLASETLGGCEAAAARPRCTELTLVWGRTDATCLQVKNSPNLFKTRESPPPSSWPRTVTLMASLYDVPDMSSSQPLYVPSAACYTHDVSQLSHVSVVPASPVEPRHDLGRPATSVCRLNAACAVTQNRTGIHLHYSFSRCAQCA